MSKATLLDASLASNQKKGRPRTIFINDDAMQTRIPSSIQHQIKIISISHYGTLKQMHKAMLTAFLNERPFDHGVNFKQSRASSKKKVADPWVQSNIFVPPDIAGLVRQLSDEKEMSVASILYTAIGWWVGESHPKK